MNSALFLALFGRAFLGLGESIGIDEITTSTVISSIFSGDSGELLGIRRQLSRPRCHTGGKIHSKFGGPRAEKSLCWERIYRNAARRERRENKLTSKRVTHYRDALHEIKKAVPNKYRGQFREDLIELVMDRVSDGEDLDRWNSVIRLAPQVLEEGVCVALILDELYAWMAYGRSLENLPKVNKSNGEKLEAMSPRRWFPNMGRLESVSYGLKTGYDASSIAKASSDAIERVPFQIERAVKQGWVPNHILRLLVNNNGELMMRHCYRWLDIIEYGEITAGLVCLSCGDFPRHMYYELSGPENYQAINACPRCQEGVLDIGPDSLDHLVRIPNGHVMELVKTRVYTSVSDIEKDARAEFPKWWHWYDFGFVNRLFTAIGDVAKIIVDARCLEIDVDPIQDEEDLSLSHRFTMIEDTPFEVEVEVEDEDEDDADTYYTFTFYGESRESDTYRLRTYMQRNMCGYGCDFDFELQYVHLSLTMSWNRGVLNGTCEASLFDQHIDNLIRIACEDHFEFTCCLIKTRTSAKIGDVRGIEPLSEEELSQREKAPTVPELGRHWFSDKDLEEGFDRSANYRAAQAQKITQIRNQRQRELRAARELEVDPLSIEEIEDTPRQLFDEDDFTPMYNNGSSEVAPEIRENTWQPLQAVKILNYEESLIEARMVSFALNTPPKARC